MSARTIVLDKSQIKAKINRIVHQIHEQCYTQDEIIICGVLDGHGQTIADRITKELKSISDLKIISCTILINKEDPLADPIQLSIQPQDYANKTIIIVDDVSNSGKTLMYAAKHFMDEPIKAIHPIVLVDRNHSRYPVKPSFVGMTVSTTMQDHINVEITDTEEAVYLV